MAAADSRGNAGGLDVQVGRLVLTGGSQIDSSTRAGRTGRGGELMVTASEAIAISGRGSLGVSGLFSGTSGEGAGGAVTIDTPLLTMDGGLIPAFTVGAGNAGTLTVGTGRLLLSGGAQLSSNTQGQWGWGARLPSTRRC